MHIIGGIRRTERLLGYVADFCPICREVRAFRLVRVGLVGHLYYISFGAGKLIGHIIRCEECGVDFETDPTRYASIEKKRPVHFSDLVPATFPNFEVAYAAEFAQEDQIRRAPRALPPGERQELLIAPFRHLHGAVAARYAGGGMQLDKQASLGCLGTFVLILGLFALAAYLKGAQSDNILIAILSVFCLGSLYTLVQTILARGRFLRARIIPPLARALDRLQPDETELLECLKRCREIGWTIGSKVKARQILAEIERRRARMEIA
jgi:hypothetical protein